MRLHPTRCQGRTDGIEYEELDEPLGFTMVGWAIPI